MADCKVPAEIVDPEGIKERTVHDSGDDLRS